MSREFVVWAVEEDECFEISSREDLVEATFSARDELEENPAASGVFVTIGKKGEITYAIFRGGFRSPEVGGYVSRPDGRPVISHRVAEALLREPKGRQ